MTGQEGSQGRLLDRRATADSGGRPQSARRRAARLPMDGGRSGFSAVVLAFRQSLRLQVAIGFVLAVEVISGF